ncbi:hypothetical protein LCGC14_1945740, partial [marine sediment metagenome]
MNESHPDAAIVEAAANIVAVSAEASVLEAAARLHGNHVGCLVVNDDSGRIIGILTERDVVRHLAADPDDVRAGKVRDIMTAELASCPPGTSIEAVRETMAHHGIRHLPVVVDDVAVGVISIRDVMGRQLELDRAMRSVAEQVAMLGIPLIYASSIVLKPIIWVIAWIARIANWIVGGKRRTSLNMLSREELKHVIEEQEEDRATPDRDPFNRLVSNIFTLRKKVAREAMTPLPSIRMLRWDSKVSD